MAKKLIICCDGTGNEIKDNQSNVLKFYHLLKQDENQLTFYDPGVGIISDSNAWEEWLIKSKTIFGLATGFGIDQNVMDAYRFLVKNYQESFVENKIEKDEIYLYGFSRGAYTVRVLAGLIHMVGILKPEQEHLISYALTTYKKASRTNDMKVAWRFNEILKTHRATIELMGCWDTVGSVIVPKADKYCLPSLEDLPFVNENPSVRRFRHALAIDEQRRMFRVCEWVEPQTFKWSPYLQDDSEHVEPQDIKQVWFAGVHSDIGGGYAEKDSGLAKITLRWMIHESKVFGLKFRSRMYSYLVLGKNPKNNPRNYCPPNPAAKLHDSMGKVWKLLEYVPKSLRRREWHERQSRFGFYLPKGEPRVISENDLIHQSVEDRINSLPRGYQPINLPSLSKD